MSLVNPKYGTVTVRELVQALDPSLNLILLAGRDGLVREIRRSQLQKPGLALAGSMKHLYPDRIQVLGRSEIAYLFENLEQAERALSLLCSRGVPAILVTQGLQPPALLVELAADAGVPVICTKRETTVAIDLIHHFLAVRLAARIQIHGVLMDVFGVGMLILGDSGIGKSECALELVTRGHRLVADDAVEIRLIEGELIGASPATIRHFLEVRGLGLINTREMFGISSVKETKVVEQAIRLVPFEVGKSYDRLGDEGGAWELLEREVPLIELPVAPGRNVAVLIEIAARRRLLIEQGSDPVGEIQAAMARRLEPHDDPRHHAKGDTK